MLQRAILLFLLVGFVSSHEEQIFATKTKLDMSWTAIEGTPLLTVQELYRYTDLVSPYLQELLSQEDEGSADERVTLRVTMEIADHSKIVNELLVESMVTMWYVGHEPVENLSTLLDQV
ncbi:hypothetical protein MHU86_18000 [Fragilaria crotonensis]|nr:hypothetical protein MHU86_18000 [Fragilaria crotonensis]